MNEGLSYLSTLIGANVSSSCAGQYGNERKKKTKVEMDIFPIELSTILLREQLCIAIYSRLIRDVCKNMFLYQ